MEEDKKPKTYIDALKAGMIKAYKIQTGGLTRSLVFPVFPELLDKASTEVFLKVVGVLERNPKLGVPVEKDMRVTPGKDGTNISYLEIVLTVGVDTDIDKIFDIIAKVESKYNS